MEPLVRLMQDTPVARLLPALTARLKDGTDLRQLVAAAALANARTFGGEDYVGFHTMMALAPAYHMARELPTDVQPLPVFKVLYGNTNRIQEHGGPASEVMSPIRPAEAPDGRPARDLLPAPAPAQHHLLGRTPGDRQADDAWIEATSRSIFESSPAQAAQIAAAALADGFAPSAVGEAISLAANQLILRDMGRTPRDEVTGKPMGSVH